MTDNVGITPAHMMTTTVTSTTDGSFYRRQWRVGRRVGRTIYAQVGDQPSDSDPLIGVMDDRWLAESACRDHNAALSHSREKVSDA